MAALLFASFAPGAGVVLLVLRSNLPALVNESTPAST